MKPAHRRRLRLAVLVSGRGSNLQALIDAIDQGRLHAQIVAVLSNRSDAQALRRAEVRGIASLALDPGGYPTRADFDRALFERVAAFAPDLVVLAGFMRVLDASVVRAWQGRMINIHPSLLPKYPGLHTHRRALDAGDREHGASVHFVGAEVDAGPVIAQARIRVLAGDTPETLASRLLPREHQLLTGVCALIAEARLTCTSAEVKLDGRTLGCPLELTTDGRLSCPAASP
ncbi:MAG TPA: phosphoribosylglycinamide formyltransferase [Xanthomonadaceae bacterium]|nr:phosphoribosylglycinamide formyltransferase [Xanthomonadaceae bacterium]